MTQHTSRDAVWDQALRCAIAEGCFTLEKVRSEVSTDVSDRTIRDTLNTMVDKGWLSKERQQGREWMAGPQMKTEEASEGSGSKTHIATVSNLSQDTIYTGVVDRFRNGNGLIDMPAEVGPGYLNAGPISETAEGDEIEFEFIGAGWAKCLTSEYTYPGYSPRDGRPPSSGSSSSSSSTSGSGGSSGHTGYKYDSTTGDVAPNDPSNKNKLLKGNM